VVIHVHGTGDLPSARFVSSDLTGYVGQPVGFDATFSTDPNNDLVSYDWDFGDGSRHGSGQLISRVYTAPGTYTVTLIVTNGFGLTDTTSLTMVVLPAGDAGLFPSTLKYSVSWNRGQKNNDSISLAATVNIGDAALTGSTPLSLGIVGQTYTGTTGVRGQGSGVRTATNGGAQVKWTVKPGKKGSPKGTVQVQATIKHASIGLAFVKAGATGSKSATVKIPVGLQIGAANFQSSINSQFRFGSNGAKASGGGTGPK
jgi:PKD repeat protein